MSKEKIFIIGDIHGCLDMLKKLIHKIAWNPLNDRLIFIGDYIDRGEDIKSVIDFILELKNESPLVECLIGNHEKMFLDYLTGDDIESSILNGGLSTIRSYKKCKKNEGDQLVPQSHLSFFYSLLPMIELEEYYLVHAGFRPCIKVKEQSLNDMIWIRDEFIYSDYDFGKVVIFGHTPFDKPLIMNNKVGIDTGAVFGNRLTCLELPEKKFHYVEQ